MYFKTEAGSIYYEASGPRNAPAVVFTHGGGLNGDMFKSQVRALKDQYRVVTWDLQGHGRSAALNDNLDVPKMAECLVGIIDEVGIEEAVLVGQSLGVYVSQHAALKYPRRVKAHVSIGGLPVEKPMSKVVLYGFRVLMSISRLFPEKILFKRTAREKATTKEAQDFFYSSLQQMGKEQFLLMLAGQLDACTIRVPGPPTQPLFIVHGEHEMPKSLVKANKEWHRSVPGSRYLEIPGAGHNANMDKPEVFNRELLDFLEEVWGTERDTAGDYISYSLENWA